MADLEWYADATLFADLEDRNPLVVDPPEDLTADAAPLRRTESYLVGAIDKYVSRVTGGQRGDLHTMIDLTVEETYARLGYPHSPAYGDPRTEAGPSHTELRDLPDPTPADFRDTLTDICDEPEEYVRRRQIAERTGNDALALLRMLPNADNWDIDHRNTNPITHD